MTAHTRTASLAPGFTPATTAHASTRRHFVIAGSFLLEAVIVLGFVSSSVGLGAAPSPDPDHGWATSAPSTAPAASVAGAATVTFDASAPQPAPEAAPASR